MLNFLLFGGFACEQTLISFFIFWREGKLWICPLKFSLWWTLKVDFFQLLSFSGGPETFPYVSLLVFYVETEHLKWVRLLPVASEFSKCFHWISDEFYVSYCYEVLKRSFHLGDCKMFLLVFNLFTIKNRRFTCQHLCRKIKDILSSYTYKSLGEMIWRSS